MLAILIFSILNKPQLLMLVLGYFLINFKTTIDNVSFSISSKTTVANIGCVVTLKLA